MYAVLKVTNTIGALAVGVVPTTTVTVPEISVLPLSITHVGLDPIPGPAVTVGLAADLPTRWRVLTSDQLAPALALNGQ